MTGQPRGQRRGIGIPRGILRHITLQLIKKEPLSGSELMEEIKQYSDWKPSPGSIYPLLSSLKEEGMIEIHSDEDPSLKRFNLTEKGIRVLEENKRYDKQFHSRHRSMRKIYWKLHREMPEDIFNSFAALIDEIERVYIHCEHNQVKSNRLKEILEESKRKLEEIGE